MPDVPQTASSQKVNKPFWGSIGLIQKAVLFIVVLAFVFIGAFFLFGGINSIYEFVFVIMLSVVLTALAYIVLWAQKTYYTQQYYSPKEDWFTRLTNTCVDSCPANIKGRTLYFQGSVNRSLYAAGKIIGCMGIPYLVGDQDLDKDGKPAWVLSESLKMKVPKFKNIYYGEDGDTFFIYEAGSFLFKRRHYLRCHRTLHGDLNGDVAIMDINPVPYGKFFEYPFKQWQKEMGRLMIQSQLETIIATHEHQGDLISQAADAGLYFNPWLRYIEQQKAEVLREG